MRSEFCLSAGCRTCCGAMVGVSQMTMGESGSTGVEVFDFDFDFMSSFWLDIDFKSSSASAPPSDGTTLFIGEVASDAISWSVSSGLTSISILCSSEADGHCFGFCLTGSCFGILGLRVRFALLSPHSASLFFSTLSTAFRMHLRTMFLQASSLCKMRFSAASLCFQAFH